MHHISKQTSITVNDIENMIRRTKLSVTTMLFKNNKSFKNEMFKNTLKKTIPSYKIMRTSLYSYHVGNIISVLFYINIFNVFEFGHRFKVGNLMKFSKTNTTMGELGILLQPSLCLLAHRQ